MIYCFHMKQYIIELSPPERVTLASLLTKGKHRARVIMRARILLESDAGKTDGAIAAHEGTSTRTVQRIRERYHNGGLDRALYDAPRSGTPPVLDPKQEAHLVALACSDPPDGHRHWTIELLRDRLRADKIVHTISVGTIHARLTERGIKPWREKNVVHPAS